MGDKMDKVISCIVLAAGAGRRMAYKENKIFIPLGRYSIIQHTLQNVAKLQGLSEIILVVADGEQDYMAEHIKVLNLTVPVHIVLGGAEDVYKRQILKRNELADELNCAPSQISYVLSTRFSNERGFDVESRRGLGGYIRIKKLNPESSDSLPAVTTYRIYEGQNTVERLIDMRDVDQSLFQLLQSEKITRREAQLMHNSFATLIENVDIEERNEAVRQL